MGGWFHAPTDKYSPQTGVRQRQSKPLKATKVQRRCSAALFANYASARQNGSCLEIASGFDPHRRPTSPCVDTRSNHA
jgi:hypothetical protein